MHRPPPDPRHRIAVDQPTWRGIFVSFILILILFLAMVTWSSPLPGALAFAVLAGLLVGMRRVAKLTRCFHECGGFSVDLAGRVRITICRPRLDSPN